MEGWDRWVTNCNLPLEKKSDQKKIYNFINNQKIINGQGNKYYNERRHMGVCIEKEKEICLKVSQVPLFRITFDNNPNALLLLYLYSPVHYSFQSPWFTLFDDTSQDRERERRHVCIIFFFCHSHFQHSKIQYLLILRTI